MAITAFTATENWADGANFTEAKLEAFTDALDTWIADEIEAKCPDKTSTDTINGAWTFSGIQTFTSGLKLDRTAAGAGNYTVLTTDYIIGKTAITGGGDTVNLPAVASAGTGRVYVVVDESGSAGTDNITIATADSATINGSNTNVISTNYGFRVLYCNGTNWFIIASG